MPALAGLAAAAACGTEAPELRVRLVPEHATVPPGASLVCGVHFELPAGWHTYWLNPGDSGLAARFEWSLPEGLERVRVDWPAPDVLGEPGAVTYGYETGVTALAVLRVAPSFPAGDCAIGLRVRWLACREVCVPADNRVTATVRVAAGPAVAAPEAGLVRAARERVPQPAAGWSVEAWRSADSIRLIVAPPAGLPAAALEQAMLFPAQGESLQTLHRPNWQPAGPGRYQVELRAIGSPAALRAVEAVLAPGYFGPPPRAARPVWLRAALEKNEPADKDRKETTP